MRFVRRVEPELLQHIVLPDVLAGAPVRSELLDGVLRADRRADQRADGRADDPSVEAEESDVE